MSPTLRQKARFFRQLYTGHRSGLQFDQLLHRDYLPRPYQRAREHALLELYAGKTLADTLLSANMIAKWEARLIAVGESTGQLERVLADLSTFHEQRSRQFHALRAKLLYPFLVLVVAIVVRPLPQLAAGSLDGGSYLADITLQLLFIYALYFACIVLPFERASSSAFSAPLIWSLRWLGPSHWLRLQFDIDYLNLLTLCLGSGLDATETLKLLRENSSNIEYRQRHARAIRNIASNGLGLTQVLFRDGLIKHPVVLGFLHINETSGTLHDDLHKFALRMQDETARTAVHFMKQVGFGIYVLGLGILLAGYL